jgi:hypothetical protein
MHAYEGYIEDGMFYPLGTQTRIAGRHRVILTMLDEPVQPKNNDISAQSKHAQVWRKFLREIKECNEQLGDDFDKVMGERVNFTRELDL